MSQYADSIDSTFREDPNSSWFKVYNYIKPDSTVLDVGCSGGSFGRVLIEKKHCTVDGIELDKADAAKAAQAYRKVYTNNLETEGDGFLANKKYDIIYFGDVLEHLVHPAHVLALVKKHLTPTGAVAFSVPNMAHMSVRLMLLKGEFRYGEMGLLDKTHLHFYDKEEITRIVQKAGFEFADFDYVRRDIPRDVLTAELNSVGLKPSKDFLDNSKKVESSAYQFIGLIKPAKNIKKIKQLPRLSPAINEMEKHITYIKEVHDAQISAHKERIAELEKQVQALETELEHISNPLRRIKDKLNSRLKSDR